MKLVDLKQFDLPDAPGVYFFKRGKEILYIGKATSLSDRVKSYFSKDIFLTRGPKIAKMLEEADTVDYVQTDSVLEALILEANEIRKHQPVANTREKDDKSYNYVVITKEEFPKLLIVRGRNLLKIENSKLKIAKQFGPFPHGSELREALKIVRRIFPYRDEKCKIVPGKPKPCFNAQIGLCPGPCAGRISKQEYAKTIRNIRLFFEGKKTTLVKTLEREMNALAKAQEFEAAEEIKRKIFALDHIQDVALIKSDLTCRHATSTGVRIEAYDIAHLSGKDVVGVMTVVEGGEVAKSQYRKFKIKLDKNDDTKNLKEVLSRRFAHPEWRFPNLIVVDGGKGQINAARKILDESGLEMIDVVSVVKDERHRPRHILGNPDLQGLTLEEVEKAIVLANAEAHRFAVGYHRKLRGKGFRI
jgi:excinuclease ABC subunit C